MDRKLIGIIATTLSVALCGCPGLFACAFGAAIAFGAPVTTTLNGQTTETTLPPLYGVVLVLVALVMLLIPVIALVVTLRMRSIASSPAAPVYASPAPAYQPAAPAPFPPAVAPAQPVAAPPPVTPAASSPSQDVYNALMALNRPTAPYQIVDGRAENCDLIAEWKIVDAGWYEVFGQAGLKKVFRIYMKLDPAKREVRMMDREFAVQWSAGVPQLGAEASFFQGQKAEISFGTGYAFTEQLEPGVVYRYKFNTSEIKTPVKQAVEGCGWKVRGVALGKL
ncbi:MAG: hypothetical protein IT326_10200 [Anaerolineae bacterium]|nr:hypothetical protein [Anaerolineae bacterium]